MEQEEVQYVICSSWTPECGENMVITINKGHYFLKDKQLYKRRKIGKKNVFLSLVIYFY